MELNNISSLRPVHRPRLPPPRGAGPRRLLLPYRTRDPRRQGEQRLGRPHDLQRPDLAARGPTAAGPQAAHTGGAAGVPRGAAGGGGGTTTGGGQGEGTGRGDRGSGGACMCAPFCDRTWIITYDTYMYLRANDFNCSILHPRSWRERIFRFLQHGQADDDVSHITSFHSLGMSYVSYHSPHPPPAPPFAYPLDRGLRPPAGRGGGPPPPKRPRHPRLYERAGDGGRGPPRPRAREEEARGGGDGAGGRARHGGGQAAEGGGERSEIFLCVLYFSFFVSS